MTDGSVRSISIYPSKFFYSFGILQTNAFIFNDVEGFVVAAVILLVGQTRQNLQWMYEKNHDLDAC